MTITLYTTGSPVNMVDKVLTTLATVTGTPTKDFNVSAPEFDLSYSSNALAANYMYVSELGKYYFLKPPVVRTDGIVTIRGDVDLLKTYSSGIKAAPATVVRSESAGLSDVPDSKLPINPNAVDIVSALSNKSFANLAGTPGLTTWAGDFVLITGRGKS